MKKIIYIGGYGRSGSTLLERIIASHPKIIGCGELHNVEKDIAYNEQCGCGQKADQCPVFKNIIGKIPDFNKIDLRYLNLLFLPKIKFLVDSSKTTKDTALRPVHLEKYFEVYFIYLKRKRKAVVKSQLKALSGMKAWIILKTILSRFFANLQALYFTIHFDNSLKLDYEEIINTPDVALEKLEKLLSLSYDHINLPDDEIPATHQMSGNLIRYTEPLRIKN